jgi:DNA-binding protein H-NS
MGCVSNFNRFTVEELWTLHVSVNQILERKIEQEKLRLENRLGRLRGSKSTRYPPVLPKYRNPDRPSETWTGRGKQPRWLAAQLRSGRALDEFRIEREFVRT